MGQKLAPLSTYAGYLGMLLCVIAAVGRYYGGPQVLGFRASSFFLIGVGALVWACWLRLELGSHSSRDTG